MADADCRVIQRADDGFAVEVTRTGALPQTAAGFATEAEADAWIAQDKRLWEAADPSERRRIADDAGSEAKFLGT